VLLNVTIRLKERIGHLQQQLLAQNSEMHTLHRSIQELQSNLQYSKQRESKLMFFLFCLKESGCDVAATFDRYIRDTLTQRFSAQFDDDYKQLLNSLKREQNLQVKSAQFAVDRDALFFNSSVSLSTRDYKAWSLSPSPEHSAIIPRRPLCVPLLDLESIRLQNLVRGHTQPETRPNNPAPREHNRILDCYGIQTGARCFLHKVPREPTADS
jgi:hypothetical protein